MDNTFLRSENNDFNLMYGNCITILPDMEKQFDMVFADPPYFLSNGGQTIQSGKIVSVDKGEWDKETEDIDNFNRKWIAAVREKMKEDATIWISGTHHNIFSIGRILNELDFKILNIITWEKTNPPPNFSCRYFTHSTEQVIWARKSYKKAHYYNYDLMKQLNGGKQMKDVWRFPAIAPWEKKFDKHPTQKSIALLCRLILASTKVGDLILDPFSGAGTTGIAANLLNRYYTGVDINKEYLDISIKRKNELDSHPKEFFLSKINGIKENLQIIKDTF